jgi:hypothetical protein
MKSIWVCAVTALACVGCNNDKGVPGRDDSVQTGHGNPGATPNQIFTVSNSSQQTSVPREGGNLDRGATRDNDPSRNAPGSGGKALNQSGSGTGTETK